MSFVMHWPEFLFFFFFLFLYLGQNDQSCDKMLMNTMQLINSVYLISRASNSLTLYLELIITWRYVTLIFITKIITVDILLVVIVTVGHLDLLLKVIQSLSSSQLCGPTMITAGLSVWLFHAELPPGKFHSYWAQLLGTTKSLLHFYHQPNALSVRFLWACLWFWHDLFLLSTKFPL